MSRTIYDPIVADVSADRRKQAQEEFGRHLVEQRNFMAALVRKWIETDSKFPIPIYDRMLDRVRRMDAETRADVASIALLMADQVVKALLGTFDLGNDTQTDGRCINYAVIAQARPPDTDEVQEEVDINRGEPVIAVWNAYTRWLSRYAPSELRASTPRGCAQKDPRNGR